MKKFAFITLVLLIALSGIAAADPYEPGLYRIHRQEPSGAPFWENERVASALSMTAEEIARLAELSTGHRAMISDLREKLMAERQSLREIMESEDYSASSARKQFNRAEELQSELARERFNLTLDQRDILGQERYLKLQEMNRRAFEKRSEHRRRNM